ncbi:DMT family transporter [Oceanirhabdus sp. W0125-5]|uniref:DMT family transporter n=1 Tax=Oceanirhabdus sp. W0125-5 TaxID=2999116 RepID=UPI0022F34332|nr:DMT family transporter [Oceanirhabdus sp. W0125-5]WBW97701.1 DMT family transporter [Oceanirhabdus sp. W0125-5]
MKFIFAVIAGLCMTFQGVFNTRLSEKIGLWETNVFVQGTALVLTFIIMMIFGDGNLKDITDAKKLYLTGGIFGAIIIFTVMLSIEALNPTIAIGIILISQLTSAGIIEAFGWFGTEATHFTIYKYIGVGLMLSGIALFNFTK